MLKLSLLILSLLTLTACNGGGGGGAGSTSVATRISSKFIDSPVEGLGYLTDSGLQGVTAADGSFPCNVGERVEFFVGNITIGHTACQSAVYPQDIANSDRLSPDQYSASIALVLHYLDSNSDSSDGIQIDSALHLGNVLPNLDVSGFANTNAFISKLNDIQTVMVGYPNFTLPQIADAAALQLAIDSMKTHLENSYGNYGDSGVATTDPTVVETGDYRLATHAEIVSFIRGSADKYDWNSSSLTCLDFNSGVTGWQSMTRNSKSYIRYGNDVVSLCVINSDTDIIPSYFTVHMNDLVLKDYYNTNFRELMGLDAGIAGYGSSITDHTLAASDLKLVSPEFSVTGGYVDSPSRTVYPKVGGIFVVVGTEVRFFRGCQTDLDVMNALDSGSASGKCSGAASFENGYGTIH